MPDSSSYVPGYQHDVFVSYAQVDNQTLGGDYGWVHTLVDNLKEMLSGQLGRREWGDIWLDRRIEAGDAIPREVLMALESSALLVVVMSEGYLESPWCTREREDFIARMQQQLQQQGVADGRIFLVHKKEIARERQPEPFRDLIGMEFFQRTRESAEARTLGFPLPDPRNEQDKPYYQRLDDLSLKIAQRLREMRQQAGGAPARASIPPALAGVSPTSAVDPGTPQLDAIFLAETTPDLKDRRDILTRQLGQSGLSVLPASYYARSPEAFGEAMRRDLAESLLFVQILGPYASPPTPGLPGGYEGLQLDLAEQHGLPVLRWCDPALDSANTSNSNRELFERAEFIQCGFEDFMRQVEQRTRRLQVHQTFDAQAGSDSYVLISAADSDEEMANQIGDALDEHGVGYELVSELDNLDELLREQQYQGLIVIYDHCERDWARARVRQCRSIMLRLKDRAPACAVYDQPRANKPRLGIKFRNLHMLSKLQAPDFQCYIDALHGAAVP